MAQDRSHAPAQRAGTLFNQPGLFMVRVDKPKLVPAVEETLASLAHERLGPPGARPTPRQKSGVHRYCSGCAHETEHVAWVRGGQESIPSIRWPAAEPASGTTACLNCGQWRPAASQAGPTAWSRWPRNLIALRNQGMPPKGESRRARAA